MDPTMGAVGQADALQATLRLLVGLLIPCLLLLLLLSGLFWLRWRPTWPRVKGKLLCQAPPASPQLFQVVPGSAVVRHGREGVTVKQLLQPVCASPLPSSRSGGAAGPGSSRGPPRLPTHFYSLGQFRNGVAQGMAPSSSSDLEKHPVLVPPNSPETTASGAHDIPDGAFTRRLTSTQSKLRSCSRSAGPSHSVPFEYNSSIRRDDQRAPLNSANFTASQGPGLDSDFGASAGVSVRILSSDSEESPNTPLLCPRQSGRFEWDYYDPSYKRQIRLHHQLPRICSKQYWL